MRLRRLRVVVAALAAFGAAGCEELLYGPKAPAPGPPPAPSAPPVPETCASWKPTGPPDTPSAEELRALLGKLDGSSEVDEVMLRLGMSEVQREGGVALHTYADRGLQLRFRTTPAGEKLAAVRLYGRASNAKGFAGALPERLSFALTEDEVGGVLGAPENRYCWISECHYQDRGLSLRSDRGQCLSSVELTAPLAQNQVRYEEMSLRADAVQDGVHGIAIGYLKTSPRVKGYTSTLTRLCFDDDKGKPRMLPRWARPRHDEDGRLCLPVRGDLDRTTAYESVFVPYALLDQAPGAFTLTGRISTTLAPGGGLGADRSLPPIELEPTGESRTDIAVQATMPELQRARLSVRRAQVKKGSVYDDLDVGRVAAAIATGGVSLMVPIPQRWERPDLQWAIRIGGHRAYRSQAFQDVYSASWGGSSTPVPLAPEDHFSVCLEDQDGLEEADTIKCFDFTLDTYAAQVKSGKPLSEGAVEKLVLGPAAVAK